MDEKPPSASGASAGPERQWLLGLLAAPGLPQDLAEQLARRLPPLLQERYPGGRWKVVVDTETLADAASIETDLVQLSRRRMLEEGWDYAVCLTDLPLHAGRRPVTAEVSVTLGVAVVAVPALGPAGVEERVLQAVLRVIGAMQGEDVGEVLSPEARPDVQEGGKVRFITGTARGNLRLLVGMVRANRPWRVVIGLSRALVAALGFAVFGLTSPGIWKIADAMSTWRLLALSLGSILIICITLVVAHGLWERSPSRETRQRVLLVNLATTGTITLGVLTLWLMLLVINGVCGFVLIAPRLLTSELHHGAGLREYILVAAVVSSLATLGGALGAALESHEVVREAAYGVRPSEHEEERREGGQRRAASAQAAQAARSRRTQQA